MRMLQNIVLLLIMLSFPVRSAQRAPENLTLLSSVRVRGSEVFLSDIVKEDIGSDLDRFVTISPGWLSRKTIQANFVRNLIRGTGRKLTGAGKVMIIRDVINRSGEIRARIEEIISAELAGSRWKNRCKSLDFRLVDFPEEIIVPSGDFTVECSLPGQIHGPRNISFTVKGRDRFKRRYSVKADFALTVDCPVAVRNIRKGEKIRAGDITWVEKNLADCYREPASRNSGLPGLQTGRFIRKGELIPADALERIPEIKEGDEVEIVLQRGSLTVKVVGRSLEDGHRGERIMVRNRANGKIEKYCVVDRGRVSPDRLEVGSE